MNYVTLIVIWYKVIVDYADIARRGVVKGSSVAHGFCLAQVFRRVCLVFHTLYTDNKFWFSKLLLNQRLIIVFNSYNTFLSGNSFLLGKYLFWTAGLIAGGIRTWRATWTRRVATWHLRVLTSIIVVSFFLGDFVVLSLILPVFYCLFTKT